MAGKMKVRHLPNAITALRILLSISLLFLKPGSFAFLLVYLLAGISDMLDGFLARRLKCETETGSKLDSLADVIFIIVCFTCYLPTVHLSRTIWLWIGGIAAMKAFGLFYGISHNRAVMLHTVAEKVTGLMLFMLPLIIRFAEATIPAIVVCAAASFGAIDEAIKIIKPPKTE